MNLRIGLTALLLAFTAAPLCASANETIQLQLKWKHAFQFAGFYMALEKGYYKDAGLDVTLIEGGPGKLAVKHVLGGEGHYALADTGALIAYSQGKEVKALAAIYQHSPLALLVLKKSGIKSIADLRGKRIMLQPGYLNSDILAAFAVHGITESDFIRQDISYNIDDLINGSTDAFSVYITDQPHQLKERGIASRIFHPNKDGIDFYGDILITSEKEAARYPERVNAMIDASMKGWVYALEHIDETIDVIQRKYNSQNLSLQQLHFEAAKSVELIIKDVVNPGYMSLYRWQHIRDIYAKQGLLAANLPVEEFLYQRKPTLSEALDQYLWQLLLIAALLVALLLAAQSMVLRRIVRKRTAALKASLQEQKRFTQAIEQASEAILITDHEGIITYVNPAFTSISGYSREEAIGHKPSILTSGEHPESYYRDMWNCITSGKVWKNKCIEKRKDDSLYPVMQTISPIRNEQGEITHFVAVHEDMSELEAMESRFRQAQKMEALGTLVGGIAHDFNNMLAAVSGNIFMAQQEFDNREKAREHLEIVNTLVFRAADMISQLLAFASKSSVDRKPLPLSPFIRETLKLHKVAIPEDIELKVRIAGDIQVRADATQLQQVIINLISNAKDAVAESKKPAIHISLDRFQADRAFTVKHSLLHADTYARLTVADNGHGISDNDLQHIFDPFYTTKEVGKGSGLGLSMVFGAVQSHDGLIEVERHTGGGTSFHIYMPILEGAVAAVEPTDSKYMPQGDQETILMAEDESELMTVNVEMLKQFGYRVIACRDGEEALGAFRKHHRNIDLVMLDLVMPKMGGVEVARQIRNAFPDMPIIFASGYDIDETLKESDADIGHYDVLSKPFTAQEASGLIRQVINTATRKS